MTDPRHGAPVFTSQMDYEANKGGFEELKEAMNDTGFPSQVHVRHIS